MTSPLAWFLAIALFLILAGAVYLARQLEAKRRAALAAWAAAGGWRFDPGPEPMPPDAAQQVERAGVPGMAGAVARYNAHQRFSAATFPRAGEVAMHLFELRPARGAVRWSCLAAELGADLVLALTVRDDGVLTAQHARRLVVRAAIPATAAAYTELAAIARAILTQADPQQPS